MGKHKTVQQTNQVPTKIEKYNIMGLLRNEKYDSKPNMGKFLKQYVSSIRLSISNGKFEMWPKVDYSATKTFIKFNDGHELIKDYQPIQNYPHFYVFDALDEINLSQSDNNVLEKFFSYLEGFKFIRTNQQSIEQMISKDGVDKLNEQLQTENTIIERHLLSGDFTPHIDCSKLI